MMTAIALVACLYALVLAKHATEMEEELRIERRLREQAEEREEQLKRLCDCSVKINHELAKRRPMYFAGQPTLDATAYRAEHNQNVWWTYDN